MSSCTPTLMERCIEAGCQQEKDKKGILFIDFTKSLINCFCLKVKRFLFCPSHYDTLKTLVCIYDSTDRARSQFYRMIAEHSKAVPLLNECCGAHSYGNENMKEDPHTHCSFIKAPLTHQPIFI